MKIDIKAKEIIKQRVNEEVDKYPLLMKVDQVKNILEIKDDGQIYKMLNKGQVPGGKKIPGLGWRINRDVFFTSLYSESKLE